MVQGDSSIIRGIHCSLVILDRARLAFTKNGFVEVGTTFPSRLIGLPEGAPTWDDSGFRGV